MGAATMAKRRLSTFSGNYCIGSASKIEFCVLRLLFAQTSNTYPAGVPFSEVGGGGVLLGRKRLGVVSLVERLIYRCNCFINCVF